MFGYVMPEKPELRIREYEIYRAFYCGVCKSIARRSGNISRLTLNYDMTFLAILLSSISHERPEIKAGRCFLHPLKKRNIIYNHAALDYAADMNIVLSYLNLKDKWKDDKSYLSLTGMTALSRIYKKTAQRYPEKTDIILKRMEDLADLEKQKCNSVDMAAEPFAKLMEEVVCYMPICINENTVKILRWVGYNMGKWIYTIDAYDDLEEDINNGNYNPIIHQYEYRQEDLKGFKDRILKDMEFNLIYTLNQISKGIDLLEVKRNQGIIENIIFMGMRRKTESILGRG